MSEDDITEAAALWHARQEEDDMDWVAFEGWLAADARHRLAFDDIALLDAEVDRHRERLLRIVGHGDPSIAGGLRSPPPTPDARRLGRRASIAAGAIAAGAAACLLFVTERSPKPQPAPAMRTAFEAGKSSRNVTVGRAAIALASRSGIRVASSDGTRVELAGRASFVVQHDPTREFVVIAEGYEIRDLGTRFEVVSGGGAMQVSVASGEVSVRRSGSAAPQIRVAAGRSATGLADGRIVTGRAVADPPDGPGGRPLVYDAAPLGLVVADLARATGTAVTIDRGLEGRTFTGVLAMGDGRSRIAALATLAGLDARRQGGAIHLVARDRR